MFRPYVIPVWKKAPFVRMLLPLITGIMLQWYFQISIAHIFTSFVSFSLAFILYFMLPIAMRYRLKPLQGIIIQLLLIGLGLLITRQKDIRHDPGWYGNYYQDSSFLVVRIDEPLVEKSKTYKADGYVESVFQKGNLIPCKGKLLLYFSKDSFKTDLKYGDRIIIHKDLQLIKNSGNPGAFDYQRYAAFQGIYHNVFLKDKDWEITGRSASTCKDNFKQFIFSARHYVLSVLQKNMHTGKDELGIAQALLIGYTNDLDKDLVQAYSNTGVVHLIAISGMHLGLIYVLLLFIFTKTPLVNRSKLLQLVLILGCLWLFAILTGASPSVLRAAVMFSFIAVGKNYFKQGSTYNSLAASAFVLLCYNPYYLWAVGFQLSYLAVTGILIFQKHLYNCIYIRNKWLDKAWQLMTVSTAAQLLTFPVCIYYFHQFPNLFLFTNIVAVPLAIIVLYAAIVLVIFSWIPFAGLFMGKLVGSITWIMNSFILWVNDLSFAVWDKIPATVFSTWSLYAVIAGFSAWLILRNKKYLLPGLIALFIFVLQNTYGKWQTGKQQKLIVYNVPQHQAIDLVSGNDFLFIGDRVLLEDGLLQNFHIKPGRIKYQLENRITHAADIFQQNGFYAVRDKKILIVSKQIGFNQPLHKTDIDLIIISNNPAFKMTDLVNAFNCKNFVFDASNPVWKIKKWQQECEWLNLNYHSVPEAGAYVYNIGI